MPGKDWRTDNWAGHKPNFWRHGRNYDLHFPRTGREAFGHLWDGDNSLYNEPELDFDNLLSYKVSIGGLIAFLLILTALGIFFHDPESAFQWVGDAIDNIWYKFKFNSI